MTSYHYCARPVATHGYPYLVFDCQGDLHLPLIVFAKEASNRLAPSSVKKYLTGILPWFTWLETDEWQKKAGHHWTNPQEVVRDVVREYLVGQLHCRAKLHPQGGEWLDTTEEAMNAVRVLLAGLKLFYRIAKARGYYQDDNPLTGSFIEPVKAACEQLADGSVRPKMPERSGVDEPRRTKRLTDSYFLLKDTWIPQVITDTTLPQKILDGGRALKQQGKDWGLREECLICLLFETGARVSEIMTITLDDWHSRGLKDSAWARNKGSRKRRAKFVRFSEQTVKLLTRYFNTERLAADSNGYTLDDYLHEASRKEVNLSTVPIFLSKRGTPWSVDSFRTHYWKKACEAAKIDVDPHQARHWYVNQALIEIHEQARCGKMTVERGTEELIAYMGWRSGEKVMAAYNHFFQPAHHAVVQNRIFRKLRAPSTPTTQQGLKDRSHKTHRAPVTSLPPAQSGAVEAQQHKGQELYAFLIGEGGYTDDIIADLLTAD